MAVDLNLGRLRTNPASPKSGNRTQDLWIGSLTRQLLGHAAIPLPLLTLYSLEGILQYTVVWKNDDYP